MSGIVGTWRKEISAPDFLPSMLQNLSHRGPDNQGTWAENKASLGACLLHVTPESLREKPVTESANTKYLMVWDGRLDNRAELLKIFPFLKETSTDPECVLEAYDAWGEQAFSKLLGDFAFAIWDRREQSLLCVRDRIGMKPLHYCWDGQTFAFASEAKGLFPVREAQPDEEMAAVFLSFRNFKEEHQHRSFYAGIHRLPPAHYLKLKGGKLEVKRYWQFDLSRQIRFETPEEYAAAFRQIFTEAVRCRMRSVNPAATYLSGGLDSSAVVSAAGQVSEKGRLHALNFYSDDPKTDERRYASEVAVNAGVPLHMLFCRTNDFENGLDAFLKQAEAPMINTSRNLEPYQYLQERGWRAVLSGEGGDQIMDEFGFAADLLARLRLRDFISRSKRFAADFGDKPSDFMKESVMRLIPESCLWLMRRVRKNVPPAWIQPKLAKSLGLFKKLSRTETKPKFQSHSQAANYEEAVRPYAVMKLELEERAHAMFGLEPRFPFMDSRVIEFILAMPWEMRASGNRKDLLREAMKGVMPDSVAQRHDKASHTAETDRALRTLCARKRPEPLADRSGMMKQFIDLQQARTLVRRYLSGERDLRFEVWFLITTDHWLSNFSQGDSDVRKKRSEETEIQRA